MNFVIQFDGGGVWRVLRCNVNLERRFETEFKQAVDELLTLEGFETCRAIALDMSRVAMIAFNAIPMLAQFFMPVRKMRRKMYVTGLATHLRKVIEEAGIGEHVVFMSSLSDAKKNYVDQAARRPGAAATAAAAATPPALAQATAALIPRQTPDVQFLNTFVSTALESLKSMSSIEVKAAKPFVEVQRPRQAGDVRGQIYVRGEQYSGPVTISLSPKVFAAASRQILGRPVAEAGPDSVADARSVFVKLVERVIFGLRAFGWTAAIADLRVDCEATASYQNTTESHAWPTLWLPFDTGLGLVHIGFGIESED